MKRIVVIGGGAGGLATAVAAGEQARKSGQEVSIELYEALDKVGRSVLASGNGRCNFSNMHLDVDNYYNSAFVSEALNSLDVPASYTSSDNPVANFFSNYGLMYREEPDGRLYPKSNQAATVLDVLLAALKQYDVKKHIASPVREVGFPNRKSDPFGIKLFDSRFITSDKVIIACGGAVARGILPDLPDFIEAIPMLCPLQTDVSLTRGLNNVRVKCAVSLERDGESIASERGEILFRKYGVSGIAIFNLSRFAEPGDTLLIDFFPDIDNAALKELLIKRADDLYEFYGFGMTFSDFACGLLLNKVADIVLIKCGIDPTESCDLDGVNLFADKLKNFDLSVEGLCEPMLAQVRRGGFRTEQFDPLTLECKSIPGLHIIGESLDVDGPCGGYNLHWAFASGILAGRAAVIN